MNLAEVIVSASIFLGACSGAAQLGASSAQAMTQGRLQAQALASVEAQLLAVAPLLQTQAPAQPALDCAAAAQLMVHQLASALPAAADGLQRQLSLTASADQVRLSLSTAAGVRRERLYSPAAFGWCAPANVVTQPPSDAPF